MRLFELLKGVECEVIQGGIEKEIRGLSWDSRRVQPGDLFICVKNRNVDRHDFASDVIKNGAYALIIEHEIGKVDEGITVIKTDNSKTAMAAIANNYFKEPSKEINLIGVTGTNGKTSITYFISQILESAGRKTGIIGTIENSIGGIKLKTEKLNPTTPDSIELQSSLAEMADMGAMDVVMEVTSSALDQSRVHMCDFNTGIFTNLTQDHLEEHGTMENYKRAKMKLFKMCKNGVVNADDPIAFEIIRNADCPILTYGIYNEADFKAQNIKYTLEGVEFEMVYEDIIKKIFVKVPGRFTVYNSLASAAACFLSGLSLDEIAVGLSEVKGVPGRFQSVSNDRGILVVVDYAHTPDSLEKILMSVKEISNGRIITVFGCGGNRDKTKRPIMGEIAGKLSDFCFITSDNPRKEDPVIIIEEIERGIIKTPCAYEKHENRRLAIYKALDSSAKGDAVVIAGKGHETYQILKDRTIHFDDAEVVRKYMENKGKN